MNSYPLVSIIIPVYNLENYISECLESLSMQKGEDIEILIIDDGSTDNTPKLCDYYSKIDSRIKVFHLKNSGVSVARNRGLENAKGKWIWFIDGDDYVQSDSFEILKKYLAKLDCDALIHGGYYVVDGKSIIEDKHGDLNLTDRIEIINFKPIYQIGLLLFSNQLITKYNLRFLEGAKTGQDIEFLARFLMVVERPRIIPHSLYRYRSRIGSTVKSTNYKKLVATYMPKLALNSIKFFQENNIEYESYKGGLINRLLHNALTALGYADRHTRKSFKKDFRLAVKEINHPNLKKNIDLPIRVAYISPLLCKLLLRIMWKTKSFIS